jgi:methane/ammonia monooxygenase subunit B
MKRLVCTLLLALLLVGTTASAALAHGKAAQESFLRMETIAWYDVEYSGDGNLDQGEEMTITGQVQILETWPDQLAEPEVGFLGVAAPGPVVLLKERTVNGQPAPHSFTAEKGGTYEFEMTVSGRRPGEWHIHPIMGVEGAGSLLGPGQWITVNDTGTLTNEVTLYNGVNVDLENYQYGAVVGWHWIGFVIGMAWMLYWTVPYARRTVTRLAVTSQIPLNTDGKDIGLITARDHRNMNIFAGVTLLILVVGYIYQAVAWPVKIPIQVLRFEPQAIEVEPLAEANMLQASFDRDTDTLTLRTEITNTSDEDIDVTGFTTSTLTFEADELTVEPQTTVAAGETEEVTVSVTSEEFESERLIPFSEAQRRITGVLLLSGEGDQESRVTISQVLDPAFE